MKLFLRDLIIIVLLGNIETRLLLVKNTLKTTVASSTYD